MQSKQKHNPLTPHHPKKPKPWYTSQGLILGLYAGSIIVWLFSVVFAIGQMKIEPSVLILKSEGCAYLRQYGINTQSYGIESTCMVDVPFQRHMFGEGGKISYEDRHIQLADNLIVAVETIEDRPWTPSQRRLMIWVGFCSLFLFCMMFLAFRSLNRKG